MDSYSNRQKQSDVLYLELKKRLSDCLASNPDRLWEWHEALVAMLQPMCDNSLQAHIKSAEWITDNLGADPRTCLQWKGWLKNML